MLNLVSRITEVRKSLRYTGETTLTLEDGFEFRTKMKVAFRKGMRLAIENFDARVPAGGFFTGTLLARAKKKGRRILRVPIEVSF